MNKYALYANKNSFGPFTTGVRGVFEWKLKKGDREKADLLVFMIKHGLRMTLVDVSGSVLNTGCLCFVAESTNKSLVVNVHGGEGL
jgi:hypothetical protein